MSISLQTYNYEIVAFALFLYLEPMNIWKVMLKTSLVYFTGWLYLLDRENSKTILPRIFHTLWNSDSLPGTLSHPFTNLDKTS